MTPWSGRRKTRPAFAPNSSSACTTWGAWWSGPMSDKSPATWTQRARLAREQGYLPGNPWERLLRRTIERTRPYLLRQLGPEAESYLQVRVAGAMELAERLEDRGRRRRWRGRRP